MAVVSLSLYDEEDKTNIWFSDIICGHPLHNTLDAICFPLRVRAVIMYVSIALVLIIWVYFQK